MRSTQRGFLVAFVAVCCSLPAWGQAFTASMIGTVTDNTGAVVPKAVITITNLGTTASVSLITDSSGDYTVPLLPPGDYRAAAESPGFKRSVREPVTLYVDQRQRVDFALELGAVTENVTVSESFTSPDRHCDCRNRGHASSDDGTPVKRAQFSAAESPHSGFPADRERLEPFGRGRVDRGPWSPGELQLFLDRWDG